MRGAFTAQARSARRLTAARVAQPQTLIASMEQGQSMSQRNMDCVAWNAHVGPKQHTRGLL